MSFKTTSQLKSQIKRDPLGFFSAQPHTMITLCDLLFAWDNHKESFSEYQEHIADKVGCTREHVNRMLSKLHKLGVIHKEGEFREKCTYTVNPYFHKQGVRKALSPLFETFRRHAKRFLFSLLLITPLVNLSYINKKSGYITRACASDFAPGNSLRSPTTLYPKNIKKGRPLVMSEPRLQAIMALNEKFPLSNHGIAKLSAYSAAAVAYATKQAATSIKKYDPFGYIANLCHEYDTKNGYAIDWHGYQLRREAMGIPKEDIQYLDRERLLVMQSEAEESTVALAPVKQTPKREVRSNFVPSYNFMNPEDRIQEVEKTVIQMGIDKDIKPATNSAAYFAHILAFGKR